MGKFKGLIALAIVFGSFYLGWELIPPYFHKYEFQDDLDEIARRSQYTQRTDDDLRAIVIEHANALSIPLKAEQIVISRTSGGLGISVHYQIHVDLLLHPVDLDFTADSLMKRI